MTTGKKFVQPCQTSHTTNEHKEKQYNTKLPDLRNTGAKRNIRRKMGWYQSHDEQNRLIILMSKDNIHRY